MHKLGIATAAGRAPEPDAGSVPFTENISSLSTMVLPRAPLQWPATGASARCAQCHWHGTPPHNNHDAI